MAKDKKLIIVGDKGYAEIVYEYFTYDSDYEVVGFTVEQAYLQKSEMFGLPVVPLEEVENHFAPAEHFFHVGVVFNNLNRLRKRLYLLTKAKGYQPATYISSRAFVWRNAQIGEHCFIFEDNTVQPFVAIGNNVILWSGNHIGHHTTIKDHNFISSHVVISGNVVVGESCFFGVNSTIGDGLTIGDDCLIGAGAMLVRDIPTNTYVKAPKSEKVPDAARKIFGGE